MLDRMEENICKLYISIEIIFRIYKELKELNNSKGSNPVKEWAKDNGQAVSMEWNTSNQ